MIGEVSDLIRAAARNNAEWCSVVCKHHGIDSLMAPDAWTAKERTPDGYPDADALLPDVDVDSLLARIDAAPGCTVKDSFATLDFSSFGFRVLFEAQWIWRSASPTSTELPPGWTPVRNSDDLAAWAVGRSPGIFCTALLNEPDLHFFRHPRLAAGFALNAQAGLVGVGNVLCTPQARDEVWTGIVDTASSTYPGLDLVGYEADDDLDAALAAGFRTLGPLRVWIR
jgi:hypothetical protein